MRAVITPRYGAPEVLQVVAWPAPRVGRGQVEVAVAASAVTAGDRRLRAARFPPLVAALGRLAVGLWRPRHPVQGTMVAGRVVAVGAGVTRFAVGDAVFGSLARGAWAERVVVDEGAALALAPVGLTAEEAVALPYAGVTALRFLRDVGRVRPGERVLVVGAAGGVGQILVQIAAHLGAEVVAACRPAQFEQVRGWGAARCVHRDALDLSGTDRYEHIVDLSGTLTWGHGRRALTDGGRLLTLFISAGVLGHLLWGALTRRPRVGFAVAMPTRGDLDDLRDLAEAGAVRPIVGPVFPLEAVVEAHRAAEASPAGTVVLRVAA